MSVRRSGVALVGFMGSGKTTVGFVLARRLGWPFVDLDAVLAAEFGPIPDQIRNDGLATFRLRERTLALGLCDGEQRVLATGGGTFLDDGVRRELIATYHTVHLDVDWAVLTARIGEGDGRPLWDEHVERRYSDRRLLYEQAELRITAGTRPVESLVDEIVHQVHQWALA